MVSDGANEIDRLQTLGKKLASKQKLTTDGLEVHVPSLKEAKAHQERDSFGSILTNYVDEVNQAQHSADLEIERLAKGEVENLHDVTLKMAEAKASFDMMMEIRKKLEEAYDELKQMS